MKLKASALIFIVGIGVFIQFLENHKIDDEPARTFKVPTTTFTTTSFLGTATTSTTTL